MPPARLMNPALGVLFAATSVFFTSGGIVLPVTARFAAGPLGVDPTGVGVSIRALAASA